MHEGIKHAAEKIVTQIVMFFADNPCPLFTLQIEQSRRGDTQGIFQAVRELVFQPGTQNVMEKHIQPFAIPPAVHVALAQAERTFLQNAFEKIGVFYLNIGGGRPVNRDARPTQ
ncbi:hypothetical protein D3C71_878250 [compost metagenome]